MPKLSSAGLGKVESSWPYFTLRRHPGGSYLDLLRFFLNHRRFLRSQHAQRQGKSPRELMTGHGHPHWLTLLRPGTASAPASLIRGGWLPPARNTVPLSKFGPHGPRPPHACVTREGQILNHAAGCIKVVDTFRHEAPRSKRPPHPARMGCSRTGALCSRSRREPTKRRRYTTFARHPRSRALLIASQSL